MPSTQELEQRLAQLDAEIAEARQRLPAHSVKPAVMHMLLDLEDEYDRILQEIQRRKSSDQ
mgnify:CR=1 FL=1